MQGFRPTYVEIDGQPVDLSGDTGDTLDHIWCDCTGKDRALCGSDITGFEEIPLDEAGYLCVVCNDLDKTHDDFCPENK